MRPLLRLITLLTALLVAVPVAALAADADGTTPPGLAKPDKAEKPQKDEKPEKLQKDEKPAKPEKADKVPPGQEKKAADDVPDHPLGGPPGQLKDPGAPAHPEHTTLAETVGATPNTGEILVKVPGSDDFTTLTAGAPLPNGSIVDATEGLVEIGAEAPDGVEQNAVVTGGVFKVEQAATGVTDLTLEGGDFSACKTPGATRSSKTTARASKARKQGKGQVARGLWAAGKGRFRTHGRNATASVRGTRWATVDRCNSTTVKVFEGIVDVRDEVTGKTVAVRAGERHVVRERRG